MLKIEPKEDLKKFHAKDPTYVDEPTDSPIEKNQLIGDPVVK